ncbi:MAG: hypothetical protein WB998_11015 [Solirubrobacteraceae bacterium]
MGTGQLPTSRSRLIALCAAVAVYATTGALIHPAGAWAHKAPEYSLSVVEGADTQPQDTIEHVSAGANDNAEVTVSLTHNGLVVAQDTGEGGAWLSQVPQVGDVLTFASPGFTTAVTYDGLPTIDPTVCAGSNNFSGQRTLGYTVEGGYYTVTPARRHIYHSQDTLAQIQVLSGAAFGGSFLNPLLSGETVYAVESLTSSLPGGATFTYSSENDRPVGGCPPPPPPPPPPTPLALSGAFSKFTRISISKLLRHGWSTHVTINQPGTIVENLYEQHGFVPAFASSAKHTRIHKEPRSPLLARGTATAGAAGTVTVTIHPTSLGRRLLKHRHSIHVVLVTTLTANSGAKLALARRPLTLHR